MKKILILLLIGIITLSLFGCTDSAYDLPDDLEEDINYEEAIEADDAQDSDDVDAVEDADTSIEADHILFAPLIITDEQAENLAKLGKVWGFAKYHHLSFLTGLLSWDDELFRLIPIIMEADSEEVNAILYDWFIGLGDDGFDEEFGFDFTLQGQLDLWDIFLSRIWRFRYDRYTQPLIVATRNAYEFFSEKLEHGYDPDMQSFQNMLYENFPSLVGINVFTDPNVRQVADMSWINYDYLGPLADVMLRFNGIRAVNLARAPVQFCVFRWNAIFSSQWSTFRYNVQRWEFGNIGDMEYRLLGLFRVWNVMNYYYPHIDILDVNWNDLLVLYIPKMLAGTDRHSFDLTLAALSHHLRDSNHIVIEGSFFGNEFGRNAANVELIYAQGHIVVSYVPYEDSPFEIGDVILGVDGRDINTVTTEMLRYLSYPTPEKALAFLLVLHPPLRTDYDRLQVDVLRNGEELSLIANTYDAFFVIEERLLRMAANAQSRLLDNNIGYIITGDVHELMNEFRDTDGLIIDLRQHYQRINFLEMRQFLMEEPLPFLYFAAPSQLHPGAWVDILMNQYIQRSPYAFIYDRPVVVLIDENTISHGEWQTMAYRVASNVTVMGPWSMGTNGDVTWVPLPSMELMWFTGAGVFTLEGGQTHRIGLEPDIRITRTIEGIREGRDEIMEAAIEFLLSQP